MERRKVLLVTYHYPPSAAVAVYRMLGFTRHLPKFGWEVCVVAPPTMPHEPVDEALVQQIPASTPTLRPPYPWNRLTRIASRFISTSLWIPRALAACAALIERERPDAILTSSPPPAVHWIGLLLKQWYRLPWLADFRDPWVTNRQDKPEGIFGGKFHALGERLVLANADRIIINTPLGRDGILQAYPQHRHKTVAIPNGYDPERFGSPLSVPPPRDSITLLHAGELYAGRDPRPLLDALAQLNAERPTHYPAFRLRLLGQSTENAFNLEDAIRQRGLSEFVELGGQVPYAASIDAMKRADVLLLLNAPGRRLTIPAKLYEYLGARRPILALAEDQSDIAWALRTSGVVHHLVPPQDVGKIKESLVDLRSRLCAGLLSGTGEERQGIFTREAMARAITDNLNGCLTTLDSQRYSDVSLEFQQPNHIRTI